MIFSDFPGIASSPHQTEDFRNKKYGNINQFIVNEQLRCQVCLGLYPTLGIIHHPKLNQNQKHKHKKVLA